MTRDLFPQSIVAVIWDFDKTLIPGYMQAPLFKHYGVDEEAFWREVEGLRGFYKWRGLDLISEDTLYLNHLLTYVRSGLCPDLSDKMLKDLGGEIEFFEGLPEFFQTVKQIAKEEKYQRFAGIQVEHYIVSTGLRKMILGSKISPYVEGVWACEFVADTAQPGYLDGELRLNLSLDSISREEVLDKSAAKPIVDIGYVIDNTTKTRAIFEINKGTNKEPNIDVNASIDEGDRRVPFTNMLYIADGPSDVPVFSVVKRNGGKAYAVYPAGNEKALKQANDLLREGRVDAFGEADYRPGSQTHMWIMMTVRGMADSIMDAREKKLQNKVGKAPVHLS